MSCQYIYGPLTNKRDYLDWFFDRIVRGRPLPLPAHGDQVGACVVCVGYRLEGVCGGWKGWRLSGWSGRAGDRDREDGRAGKRARLVFFSFSVWTTHDARD